MADPSHQYPPPESIPEPEHDDSSTSEWMLAEEHAYRRHLPSLLAHPMQYVVIREGNVFGVFDDPGDADSTASKEFPDGRYLLRLIGPEEAALILADPNWPESRPKSDSVSELRADLRRLEERIAAMQNLIDMALLMRGQTMTFELGGKQLFPMALAK